MIILFIIIFIIIYYCYKNKELLSFTNLKTNSINININKENTDVVCLIAMWGRQDLVKINLILLQNQTKKCKVLLVVSSISDLYFAINMKKIYNSIDYIYTNNLPLGRKWQIGLQECKKYNPNAVLINGSDDLLSLDWVKTCYYYIIKYNYDIVGKSNWYILDLIKKSPYSLTYKNKKVLLGAGRMISRNILDEMNWNLFPLNQNRALDTYCNKQLNYYKARRLVLTTPKIFIISLKGKYDTLNSIENILKTNKTIDKLKLNPYLKTSLKKIIIFINRKNTNKLIKEIKIPHI